MKFFIVHTIESFNTDVVPVVYSLRNTLVYIYSPINNEKRHKTLHNLHPKGTYKVVPDWLLLYILMVRWAQSLLCQQGLLWGSWDSPVFVRKPFSILKNRCSVVLLRFTKIMLVWGGTGSNSLN
uniref:Uncharacterized protein n=1 Tax=Anguilla anguilla TaxID=7936 RepID=A0A0E9WMD0_ANGAN